MKNLEELTPIFKELQEVEADIQKMDKYAKALVAGEISSSIHLAGEKTSKEPASDEDFEMPDGIPIGFLMSGKLRDKLQQSISDHLQKEEFKLSFELNEQLTLKVLQVLLDAKLEYRDSLLKIIEVTMKRTLNKKPHNS